ncbi:MAG TPA: hypothetical protein VHP56_06265 [Solirubrobacterales bacterium]|jgi:hypothetical protein|nr:hypothetical protein [Solirubrobacterales bacterium]
MERISRNAPALLLAAALGTGIAMTLVLTSETTFFQDTWAFLINRREVTPDALFEPHNEHLVVFPVLIEMLLVRVFGMTSALPEQVLLALFLAATALLLYVYVKRRVGPWPGLFAAILVLCLGPAWEVLIWPFEVTFIGPILFGIAMLLALEREDRRGDVAACAFLTLAIGFSGLGVPFIAGAAVAILQGPRGTWLRRAYIVAIPLALYAAWYVGWGHDAETHLTLRNVLDSPSFVADSISVALASLVGFGTQIGGAPDLSWGRALLVGLVLVLAYRLVRKPKVPRGLWPVAAAATANWFLMAFNEFAGRAPISSRYQYASAIFILMILANLFKGARPSRPVLIALGVGVALAVGPNLVILSDARKIQDQQSLLTRSDTAAIEIARRSVDPDFQLTQLVAGTPSLINIYAGEYLATVDEYGSPAFSVAELASAPPGGRRQADIVLSQALPLSTDIRNGVFDAGGGRESCVAVTAGKPEEVRLDPGATRIEVPPGPAASFSLRRFADKGDYPVATTGAAGESTTTLRIPRDEASRPWYLHVVAEQPVRVCR